ncbi:MAG: O-antigen/teichoic acid export membrane protein [Candidatus Promineifilaceae bacterium]|jgi:O-antigen/teichoic acid export membrane protein
MRDELLRHSTILFSAMMAVHVCNVVFQMAVGRALSKEEYTLLAAFLGLLAMIQRPLATLGIAVSHYSSLLQQDDRIGDVKRLLQKWILLTGVPSLIIGASVVLFNGVVADFFHLDRVAPVVIAGAVFPALFILPILGGAVQGLQRFGWSSASTISGAMTRLGLGAGFVWFLYPACGWAMLGHGLGIYVSAGALFAGLVWVLRGEPTTRRALPSMRSYLIQNFFIQVAYAVLMTADVVLVKHFLPEDTDFAYAATLGRMVVFLPGVIVAAMFPKVSSRGTTTTNQKAIFLQSFKYTALFVVASIIGCYAFGGLLIRILFGITDATPNLKWMVTLMACVMGFSALLNVVVQFLVAQRRFVPAFSIIGFAVMYLVGVTVFHRTTWHVASVAGVCNAGALLVAFVAVVRIKSVGPAAAESDLTTE